MSRYEDIYEEDNFYEKMEEERQRMLEEQEEREREDEEARFDEWFWED